ncbi:MAG: hypothetical protein ACI3XE_02010 [Eubacteriales bacterium]
MARIVGGNGENAVMTETVATGRIGAIQQARVACGRADMADRSEATGEATGGHGEIGGHEGTVTWQEW